MEWRFWARTRPAHLEASGGISGDDCEAIEPLLSLYGDGMASPAEARLVEAHLPGCESCRESLAWMQATRHALSGRPVLSPPADLHARIAKAIAASEAAPLRLRPARTFATRPAFAAAASLAAVGLFLGYSLTHLPRPGVAVKPLPSRSVAAVPVTPPALVAPEKHSAAVPAVRKPLSAPQVAVNTVPDDTPPAPFVMPETVPTRRAAERITAPPVRLAPKSELPAAAPTTAPRPHQKPVVPHPTSLIATNPPVPVKHPSVPLPTKAPPMMARGDVPAAVKTPDVQVLPSKVIPQEPPAPEQTASVTPNEPRVQPADFVSELRAHVPSPAKINRTVGLSVRGITAATQTFGSDGGATRVANIVGIGR